jgi:uncharacterized membrane protein YeaQ/YmgE (transglycosylase-associated protein family)
LRGSCVSGKREVVMGIMAFTCYFLVAALCALMADRFFPSVITGGIITYVFIGVIGAWAGCTLFGPLGPEFVGVSVISTFLGSAALVFWVSLCCRAFTLLTKPKKVH